MIRYDTIRVASTVIFKWANIVNEIMCDIPSNLVSQRCKYIWISVKRVHWVAYWGSLAGDAQHVDDSESELLPRADPKGDGDPFGLEEPLCQTLPVLRRSTKQQQHRADTAAPPASGPPVSCFIHVKGVFTSKTKCVFRMVKINLSSGGSKQI